MGKREGDVAKSEAHFLLQMDCASAFNIFSCFSLLFSLKRLSTHLSHLEINMTVCARVEKGREKDGIRFHVKKIDQLLIKRRDRRRYRMKQQQRRVTDSPGDASGQLISNRSAAEGRRGKERSRDSVVLHRVSVPALPDQVYLLQAEAKLSRGSVAVTITTLFRKAQHNVSHCV